MRKAIILMGAVALVSCGKSTEEKPAEPAVASADKLADKPAEGRDPCSLVADTQALFGTPVTAGASTMTGQAVCEWKSADGGMCGSVTLFTPAYNSSPDPKVNFAAMVTSLGAFGEVKEVAGIGEEARMVDAGILGAQLAFRTASNAALVASACRSGPYGQVEVAHRLAREVAARL
jgi:hypothetical protein